MEDVLEEKKAEVETVVEVKKPRTRKKGKDSPNYNKPLSEAQKLAISQKNSHWIHIIGTKIDTGETFGPFSNIKEAAEATYTNPNHIRSCLRKDEVKHKGYSWTGEFVKDTESESK